MGIFGLLMNELFGTQQSHKNMRQRQSSGRAIVVGVRTRDGKPLVRIQRNTKPLYEERGWKVHGDTLRGWYCTEKGNFEGRVEKAFSSHPDFYIVRPPRELLDGPHGSCFRERANDTVWVHWNKQPEDVNAGIVNIEHTLLEALS